MPTAMQIPHCLAAGPLRPLFSVHGSRSVCTLISDTRLFLQKPTTHRQRFRIHAIFDQGYTERQCAAVQMSVLVTMVLAHETGDKAK